MSLVSLKYVWVTNPKCYNMKENLELVQEDLYENQNSKFF